MRHATGTPLRLPAAALVLLPLLACAHAIYTVNHIKEGICPSIDVRNTAAELQKLRNCTVIEGELSILLLEKTNYKSFENLSFPELREVTGYIKIYRVRGLRNLGDLFPNLEVIRGLTLFKDFSLIIYENLDLKAVGLKSLSRVERGAVRIEKNDKLCYANTIDWSKIVVTGVENNIIRRNYDTRLCGLCPNADDGGRLLCWDDQHSQRSCPSQCDERACMDNDECCHASCVGGCDGPLPRDCHVCRYFSLGYGMKRNCVEQCPDNFYELNKRCVTEQECRNTTILVDNNNNNSRDSEKKLLKNYKIFGKSCIHTCPSGFSETGRGYDTHCVPCPNGLCIRTCEGVRIDSREKIDSLRGCTHIQGSLEMALKNTGANTIAELEGSLGEIRVIEGALKVTRSHSLVSLSFLKSLKRIGGMETKDGVQTKIKQSLYIFSNSNLELLWNWTTHGPIQIDHGKLFIHFNPKLCYTAIEPLRNMTRDPESVFEELEVSKENNGDQASCLQDILHLSVQKIQSTGVLLTWNMYCLPDFRNLLGYSIFYIEAEHNITQYERRDACYDTWQVIDRPLEEFQNGTEAADLKQLINPCSNLQPLFYVVTRLSPFTRYAAYVKTYTTLQDRRGAQSQILYFKTLPGKPSPPENLLIDSSDGHSVNLRWSAPKKPSGILNTYRILVQINTYNQPEILQNNYCTNPSALSDLSTIRKEDSTDMKKYLPSSTGDVKDENCTCRNDNKPLTTRFTDKLEAEEREASQFEDELQNSVYKRKSFRSKMAERVKRSLDNSLVILSNYSDPVPDIKIANVTDADGYLVTVFVEWPSSVPLSVRISRLRHFSWYTVSVWACRDQHDNETRKEYRANWCSDRLNDNFRTPKLSNADVVTNVKAVVIPSNKTSPEVNVTWSPPKHPNGFVVAYNIHHAKMQDNVQTSDAGTDCIPPEDVEPNGWFVMKSLLTPGNYSIRIRPITIAGAGNVSAEAFVLIPERLGGASPYAWVWGLVGGGFLVTIVLAGGLYVCRRTLLPPAEANKLFASVNPEYVSTVYVPDEWEVPRTSIELVKELGQGSFGMVYEGIAKNIVKGDPETRCAVKTVNEHATDRERIEFLNEASVMKAFDTWHVVRLLGVVSRGQPTLVVMELMARGDLKSYLRAHRPDAADRSVRPPELHQIHQMAIEIADGMAYLSAKKFVHRDLAARNCMVAEDLTVKVGDFGMTRDIYETDYYRKGSKGLLPVRWMSPESLKDGVFSSNSDVWSYGVVLWEMATLAMQPYQGLSNEQVLRYVVEGGVMERPEHCPDRLYSLMRQCWAHRPAARPSFLTLVGHLAPGAAPHFRTRSFWHTPHGQELYRDRRQDPPPDDVEDGCGDVNVGAVATGSGSNLFGVSGRLASWVRELSSLRSRSSDDAAAEPLAPTPSDPRPTPLKPTSTQPHSQPATNQNGILRDPATPF